MSSLETVLGGDDTVRRNFSKLEDLYTRLSAVETRATVLEAELDGKTWRAGSDTVTFTAAATSATKVVTHGLGSSPAAVTLTSRNVGVEYITTARSSTTFTVQGYTTPGNNISATDTFDWVAVGS